MWQYMESKNLIFNRLFVAIDGTLIFSTCYYWNIDTHRNQHKIPLSWHKPK
jgi:hypothetical protein